jgi:hypothetical protein
MEARYVFFEVGTEFLNIIQIFCVCVCVCVLVFHVVGRTLIEDIWKQVV